MVRTEAMARNLETRLRMMPEGYNEMVVLAAASLFRSGAWRRINESNRLLTTINACHSCWFAERNWSTSLITRSD